MEDFNNAQDAALNNVEESPKKNGGRNDYWNRNRSAIPSSIPIVCPTLRIG